MKDLSLRINSTEKTDIIGFIRQCKNSPQGKDLRWIIVEGIDDLRIYRKVINFPEVNFINSDGGKRKVSQIISHFVNTETVVIGILDADFTHILNEPIQENIFITDYHDIEMMMISNDEVIENVFHEFLFDIEKFKYDNYQNRIFTLLKFISLLKLANYRDSLGLNFKPSWLDYLEDDFDRLDYQGYFTKILLASGKENLICDNLIQDTGLYDDFQLCNGHDFIIALTRLINKLKSSEKDINYKQLESSLRISYTQDLFSKTKLSFELEHWYNLTF